MKQRAGLCLLLSITFLLSSVWTSSAAVPDFQREIQPILEQACVRCHGQEKERGEFRLHTREEMMKGGAQGPAVVIGKPAESLLIELVSLEHDHEDIMPGKGDPLTRRQIYALERWVEAGAKWPEGVVLTKKERVDAKSETKYEVIAKLGIHTSTASKQLDTLIDYDNRERKTAPGGIASAPMLDDLAFLRKATLDLVGRTPTIEDITAFRKAPEAQRREKLIERLLEDDRFADRWTIFYADMLRIRSNATGGNQLLAYVNKSIRDGKAWDELARELIATNGRPSDHPAAAFALAEDADPLEMAAVTAQTFLGVRLGCAMCHNHPFDEWDQKQFYEMASFFGKTKKIETNFGRAMVYTTEEEKMKVLWPPEREKPPSRSPVDPKFPFLYEDAGDGAAKIPHIARLNHHRAEDDQQETAKAVVDKLDDLLDIDTSDVKKGPAMFDVLGEAKKAKEAVDIEGDLYKASELRGELARRITDPRNRYFSRAFVNRVWAELMGRGLFEPVDNFTDMTQVSHPKTLEHLADEFVASGYDMRIVIKMIVESEAYQRGQLPSDLDINSRKAAETAFAGAVPRRMLSEVLYDSIVQSGHLFDYKWPKGANVKEVEEQVRVSLDRPEDDEKLTAAATAAAKSTTPAMRGSGTTMTMGGSAGKMKAGYNLEGGLELNFDKTLEKDVSDDLAMMKAMSDMKLKQEQEMKAAMERTNRPRRYKYVTVKKTVDDNPKYTSSMRIQTPAPPAHFLRVFGQTSRDVLGEFRDEGASMRQALMMLNGKMTHEAARVGEFEKMYEYLTGKGANVDKAIKYAYLETLTRLPNSTEIAEAQQVVGAYGNTEQNHLDGMADLRWALLNCHEFRYLP